MITINTMFELHNVDREVELTLITDEINNLKIPYTKLLNYFTNFKSDVSFNLDKLLEGKQEMILYPLTNTDRYFNIQLKHFNNINMQLIAKKEKRDIILNSKIKERVFFFILQRFNTLLFEAIIKEGYQFSNLFIGKLHFIVNKSKKKIINWGISLKRKKEIIENGEIPYYKKEAEIAKEQGIEYKGIKWLNYLSDYNYYFNWTIGAGQYVRIPNIKMFTFIPYRGAAGHLVSYRNTFTEEELINQYNNKKNDK